MKTLIKPLTIIALILFLTACFPRHHHRRHFSLISSPIKHSAAISSGSLYEHWIKDQNVFTT